MMEWQITSAAVGGAPRLLLRLEGLCVFAGALLAFVAIGGATVLGLGWPLLALLFFTPDLSMLAYLAGPRAGAAIYNAAHAYVGPVALGAPGLYAGEPRALALAVLWTAHIGIDRALGYGLKYPTAFGDTHLGRIGRAS